MPATDKEEQQIGLILEAFGEENIAIHPENWAEPGVEVEYLYRKDKFIVRDASLDRVRAYLTDVRETRVENSIEDSDPILAGATVLTVAGDGWSIREDLLREIDEREGAGVMAYDHLGYVCVHCCAAIEPEQVAADAVPVPRPQYHTDALSRHGAGVHVRVLDTGLVLDAVQAHDWMIGVDGEEDTSVRPGQPIPQDGGHGTFTAGCVRVAAPEASVRVVNVPGGPSRRSEGVDAIGAAFESDLADLLRKQLVADDGQDPIAVPDIVVLNFAGTTRSGRPPVALAALYDSVIQHLDEVLILAPAGNEGDERKNWPASFEWVVSVGALAEDGQRAPWSNHGRSVNVYAPGDRLVNAYPEGEYTPTWDGQQHQPLPFHGMARWSGTSFSTPLVAGLVAARMSSTGQSSRRAWQSLLDLAERQAVPGVGPVLYPGQELA
jgi:hypothetical protein